MSCGLLFIILPSSRDVADDDDDREGKVRGMRTVEESHVLRNERHTSCGNRRHTNYTQEMCLQTSELVLVEHSRTSQCIK